VPFASKATGVALARIATRLILGARISNMPELANFHPRDSRVSVKAVVLPFSKFPALDGVLGPEMQSTGESMGVGINFTDALAKANLGAGKRAS
jgi:carbamoyl-phosphate synthase large subunit